MPTYSFRSFAHNRRIIAIRRFVAATDAEAMSIASAMVGGAQTVERFDLWEGNLPIDGAAPIIKKRRSGPKNKSPARVKGRG